LRSNAALAVFDNCILRLDLVGAQMRSARRLFHRDEVCRAAEGPRIVGRRRVLHCHDAYTYGAASSQYGEAD
jgi:hypothetical protein